MEFENSIIKGIHISRYIASWLYSGYPIGKKCNRSKGKKCLFIAWLESLVIDGEKLTDDEVWRIYEFAMNGKLELTNSAVEFMRSKGI